MSEKLLGVIYDPPREGLPTLAVVIKRAGGAVVRAEPALTRPQAEVVLERIVRELSDIQDS